MSNWIIRTWKENRIFFFFLVLMFVFRSSVADWNTVPTGSMKPTILEGDRIFVNKMAYDLRLPFTHISLFKISDPARGEIVIFDSEASDKRMVKRVIGVPGDIIALHNNVLYINGEQLSYEDVTSSVATADRKEFLQGTEHYVRIRKSGSPLSSFNPVKVPKGYYLMLGDNRDNSADSRVIGFVPRNEIVGRSKRVILSLDYDNYYLPRSDRYFQKL